MSSCFHFRKRRKAPDPALEKELNDIVREGASSDMTGMEKCRLKLLDLAERLGNR